MLSMCESELGLQAKGEDIRRRIQREIDLGLFQPGGKALPSNQMSMNMWIGYDFIIFVINSAEDSSFVYLVLFHRSHLADVFN